MKDVQVRGTHRVIATVRRAVKHTRRGPTVMYSGKRYLLKHDVGGFYIDARENPQPVNADARGATVLIERALGVIVLDAKIREWLQANDPKVLTQAVTALAVEAPWILDGVSADVKAAIEALR